MAVCDCAAPLGEVSFSTSNMTLYQQTTPFLGMHNLTLSRVGGSAGIVYADARGLTNDSVFTQECAVWLASHIPAGNLIASASSISAPFRTQPVWIDADASLHTATFSKSVCVCVAV